MAGYPQKEKPGPTPTIRVRNRNGKEVLIGEDDFDPERYERVTVVEVPVVPIEKPMEPIDQFSNEPAEELLTWIRTELRKLPEYKYIDNPPRDKNGMVDAIMEVREKRRNGEL